MKIELGEDDGFLFGGTPQNIVVTVTMDDGRRIKFPYSAEKSMGSLYIDARQYCNQAPVASKEEVRFVAPPIAERDPRQDKTLVVADPNRIEREDIVRCVLLEKRESSCALKVGGEYRVLKAHRKDLPGPNGQIQTVYDGFDVIDDHSEVPIRTMVFPHEVVLLRKRSAPPVKLSAFEEMVVCGFCQEPNALTLDKDRNKYIGDCIKCGKSIEAERPSAKSTDQAS